MLPIRNPALFVGEHGKVLSANYKKVHRISCLFQPLSDRGKVSSVSCNKGHRVRRLILIQLVCVPAVSKLVKRANLHCQPKARETKNRFHGLSQSLGKHRRNLRLNRQSPRINNNNANQISLYQLQKVCLKTVAEL